RSNRIGTNQAGTVDVGNDMDGVNIGTVGNPKFNTISTNVISGNAGNGVVIAANDDVDTRAQQNVVTSNKIGVDATGSVRLPNDLSGVVINGVATATGNAAGFNTVGGTSSATANQISGNAMFGVVLMGVANNNTISNNNIVLTTSALTAMLRPAIQ